MPTIAAALGYAESGEVHEGDGAQLAFLALRRPEIAAERAMALRSSLLAYCRHDTGAMVILRQFLCGEPTNI